MRKGIHPENYRLVAFKDMSNDDVFLTKSTAVTNETIEVEGVEYPLVKLEISRSSHPFYTGKAKLVDTAGRIDKFKTNTLSLRNKLNNKDIIKPFSNERLFLFLINTIVQMNYILFDGPYRENLLPFTYTKPVADLRIGILTIREKWELFLKTTTTTITEDYLSEKYPMVELDHNVMISASVLPSKDLVDQIKNLKQNQSIYYKDELIAFFSMSDVDNIDFEEFDKINLNDEPIRYKEHMGYFL